MLQNHKEFVVAQNVDHRHFLQEPNGYFFKLAQTSQNKVFKGSAWKHQQLSGSLCHAVEQVFSFFEKEFRLVKKVPALEEFLDDHAIIAFQDIQKEQTLVVDLLIILYEFLYKHYLRSPN